MRIISKALGLLPRRGISLTVALAASLLSTAQSWASPPLAGAVVSAAVGQAQYGTIKGRLVWGGDEIPPVKVLEEKGKASKDSNVCATSRSIESRELVVDPKTKGVAYAFAYLVRPNGSNPEAVQELVSKQPKVVLDQKNCEFEPYVLPMYQGQTLVVKTSDPMISHNVRINAFSSENSKNQTVGPGGQLELSMVTERRPIKVNCDIHPWMTCYVAVFDHPFFATTGTDGSFEIKGVPAGTQNLVIWQEKVGYANQGGGRGMAVEVKAGEVTDVGEIKLKVKSSG